MRSMPSTVSPFAAEDDPWLVWSCGAPLSALEEADAPSEAPAPVSDTSPMPARVEFKRPQYHAVLNRIQQAQTKAGTFSAWKS